MLKVLPVDSLSAVLALPLRSPVTSPLKLPTKLLELIFVAPVNSPVKLAPFIVGFVSSFYTYIQMQNEQLKKYPNNFQTSK